MNYVLVPVAVLLIALGVFGVVFGEADDSPGLQGLSVLLIIGVIAVVVRRVRRRG